MSDDMELEPLTLPTDLKILNVLAAGRRQTTANIVEHLDLKTPYASERLRTLEKRGWLRDAPPAERSGMYEITDMGKIAAWHAPTYVRSKHATFNAICRTIHDNQPDTGFYPDLVILNDDYKNGIRKLNETTGLVIPSEFELDKTSEIGERPVPNLLYTLHIHGLAERKDGMDVYQVTERGERTVELLNTDNPPAPVELTDELRKLYNDREKQLLDVLTTTPGFNPSDVPAFDDIL